MRYWKVIVLVLFLASCKNDEPKDAIDTSQAKTLAQYLFLDVFRQVVAVVPEYVADETISGSNIIGSSSVSLDSDTYPKTITLNYGSTNQQDAFGINRRGKIQISILSDKVTKGDMKIMFDDFYLNDTRVLGELSSSYVGSSTSDDYNLVLVDPCKIANANGTMSYSGSWSIKMRSGKSTFNVFDDTYTLNEQTTGQDFGGRSYKANSTTDYTLDFSCRWIVVAGTGEVKPNDISDQKLDMGSGNCDGIVEAEVSKDQFISFQIK